MPRYICIHGHFYQPPRENPWLEEIEAQDSAYPFHDWNERITEECYEPNAASRILGADRRIVRINNNYARISFNFGPTLLGWLKEEAPTLYTWLLDADERSRERFGGHGSAMAQAYNHIILPLANRRDKITQIEWGIRDFRHRFRREPEGMWLPETAVDLESLELMAERGIAYTVLAPRQAKRTRTVGSDDWQNVEGGDVDTTIPYWVNLPSGGRIAVFFYNGDISQAVAFEGLLRDGETFAERLAGAFPDDADGEQPRLVHIATDGETYGHHHRNGDMALAYALHTIDQAEDLRLTNYGEFLELHPPEHEAEIFEDSSWSCVHGVERWRADCGCHSGMNPGWSQAWREPLRTALDWLRDTVVPLYSDRAGAYLADPWAARDAYVDVVLDRDPPSLDAFLGAHARRELDETERRQVWKLLELQRHAMLMYTSCGWFFDELSGIETVQVIQYAARAVQLAEELFEVDPEAHFVERLRRAPSNIPAHGDGGRIYAKFVQPARVDLAKVGAHYAINAVFDDNEPHQRVYCYDVERLDHQQRTYGQSTIALGHATVTSRVTREARNLAYGVLHFGDHNLSAGVRVYPGDEAYRGLVLEVMEAYDAGDAAEALRRMDHQFDRLDYTLQTLFRDEQRRVVGRILDTTLRQMEQSYRQLYEQHLPLMQIVSNIGVPLPRAFATAAGHALNVELREIFETEDWDHERVHEILDQVERWQLPLDVEGVRREVETTVERLVERFAETPSDRARLDTLKRMLSLAGDLPFEIDPWRVQNTYYALARGLYRDYREQAEAGDETAAAWLRDFRELADYLRIDLDATVGD